MKQVKGAVKWCGLDMESMIEALSRFLVTEKPLFSASCCDVMTGENVDRRIIIWYASTENRMITIEDGKVTTSSNPYSEKDLRKKCQKRYFGSIFMLGEPEDPESDGAYFMVISCEDDLKIYLESVNGEFKLTNLKTILDRCPRLLTQLQLV